jgi:predicted GIY-YIG superfamily endonuclease
LLKIHGADWPHDVYRCYADDGSLLYVGCTAKLRARLRDHEAKAPWWPEVARVTAERRLGRREAMRAETIAIASEHPRYNSRDRAPATPVPLPPGRKLFELAKRRGREQCSICGRTGHAGEWWTDWAITWRDACRIRHGHVAELWVE